MNRYKPIGIFDSGVGGLTVVREVLNLLPEEDIVYLGDTARVPYGIRSPETVTRYAIENTEFLLSLGIKALVVACNTVSAIGLEELQKRVDIPVLGVLKPGARAAAARTRNRRVGVIGTETTILSSSYQRAINEIDPEIKVYGLACPLFVPLVEEGWTDGEVVKAIVSRYLEGLRHRDIDTLVLGCTHYPLLKGPIAEVCGEGVTLIDSAVETAATLKDVLLTEGLLRDDENSLSKRLFFVTDAPERFRRIGERFLGERIDQIEKVVIPYHEHEII